MSAFAQTLVPHPVVLPVKDLRRMIRLVRDLHALSRHCGYRELVHRTASPLAQFDPGHDAVLMGYDFHLGPAGPRLIEVNTNAGGTLLASLAQCTQETPGPLRLSPRLGERILASFLAEMQRQSAGTRLRPRRVAIVDEQPQAQFLYPEMQAIRELFEAVGIAAVIIEPGELEERDDGLYHEGKVVDLIYNRHCDFYLETPAMAAIARAYQARRLCLTPNPFVYALLGDKRRMILWSDANILDGLHLPEKTRAHLLEMVPTTRLLADLGEEAAWSGRKYLVFKPSTRFGSRGVYVGERIARSRFASLPPNETLAQALVPPSLTYVPGRERPLKTDFRLFAYQDRVHGVAARLYTGQVTNLQSEGSGFAPVRIGA
ncbi:hypothetical protein [Geoalkalibacter sp.]|uniref:hypothetical protein n=1 Tax=Geoalkalibacter sp. TaxID=3041440 RepID=UPI00272EB889|nr:hypothetical protein [Geoalkalibacter sp.]